MATATAFALGVAALVVAVVSRHGESGRLAIHAAAEPVAEQAAPGAERTVRFELHALAPSAPEPESPPGIGAADARSLFAELLQAIQTNVYDDFVAKGAASFKAAVGTGLFHTISVDLGVRLAAGYQTTSLGSLRRGKTMWWLFRLEFADGGDDVLLSMATDAWQLVGFFRIGDPQTKEKEK
jgi:hypothetical protein